MTCVSCGEKPKKCSCHNRDFPSAVVEINNPETLVLLRKVAIPASMGTEENVPPTIGKYRNVVLQYEANKHIYLYSSDGIPTLLETEVPQEVLDRIATLENDVDDLQVEMVNETAARERTDDVLQQEIDDLKNSPDVVDIVATHADLIAYDTQHLGNNDVIRVLRDETHEGQSSYYRWDKPHSTWTFIGTVGDYYTKQQVDTLLDEKQDELTPGENVSIVDESGELVISAQDTTYTAGYGLNLDDTEFSVNPEVVQDALTAGDNISIEDDSGSLVISATDTTYSAGSGLSLTGTTFSVDTSTIATQSDLTNGLATKQNTLTAGSNIQINNDTISATDTTYNTFTGTDGTSAGTSGLVPAPAATDAGKVLGANGSWVTGGPTVVQTTGTSTSDVMSQNATTSMVFADPSSTRQVQIGNGALARGTRGIAIGAEALTYNNNNYAIAIGSEAKASGTRAVGIGENASAAGDDAIAVGSRSTSAGIGSVSAGSATAQGDRSIAIGYGAKVTNTSGTKGQIALGAYSEITNSTGTMNIGSTNTDYGYNSSNYRLLTGLYDPQSAHDAATKGYVDAELSYKQDELTAGDNITIAEESGALVVSATDTTYTAGTGLNLTGTQFSVDTTTIAEKSDLPTKTSDLTNDGSDGSHAFIDTSTFEASSDRQSIRGGYNSGQLSAYGSVALGDAALASATDAVAIGARAHAYGGNSIAIGSSNSGQGTMPAALYHYAIAIGYTARAGKSVAGEQAQYSIALGANAAAGGATDVRYSIALGAYSMATEKGQMDISTMNGGGVSSTLGYNNSAYRLLTGLYDPQSAHDAATKGYVDGNIPATFTTNEWNALWA